MKPEAAVGEEGHYLPVCLCLPSAEPRTRPELGPAPQEWVQAFVWLGSEGQG